MKRILLALATFLLTYGASYAQYTLAFTYAASPTLNNLLNVSFYNTSEVSPMPTGSYTSYKLYFGDGASINFYGSTTHSYAAAGTYNVKLVSTKTNSISNAILCKDSVTFAVTVNYYSVLGCKHHYTWPYYLYCQHPRRFNRCYLYLLEFLRWHQRYRPTY